MDTKGRSVSRVAGVAALAVVFAVGLGTLVLQYTGHLDRNPWAYLGMVLAVFGALGLTLLTVAKAADEDRHNLSRTTGRDVLLPLGLGRPFDRPAAHRAGRVDGGRSRDRTCDHLLVRQVLYR